MKPTFFKSQADFRRWLDAHHADARELLLRFYKTDLGLGGLTYREALDEALAYGWIDGIRKRLVDRSTKESTGARIDLLKPNA